MSFRKKFICGVLVCCALVLAGFSVRSCVRWGEDKVRDLEKQIAHMQEDFVLARFKITARTASAISVELKFYDLSGAECGNRSLTVLGKELHIDVSVYTIAPDAYLFVPYAVFSDEVALSDGFMLSDVYPLCTQGADELSYGEKQYGSAVHDIKELASFKVGTVYAVLCHPHTGGVEIVSE